MTTDNESGRVGTAPIRSFEELTAPDERNILVGFVEARGASGFDVEVAARIGQEYLSHIVMHTAVAEYVAAGFERVRKVWSYGIFDYELFTVAEDQAALLLEGALRERFVELYERYIPLVSLKDASEDTLEVTHFQDVLAALNRGGSRAKGKWTVKLRSGDPLTLLGDNRQNEPFRGSLPQLLAWARQEGLLNGQRNRALDPLLVSHRNRVAHSSHHLTHPSTAARTIYDIGETINRLWGHRTPGGRLYPAPIERTAVVVAWSLNADMQTFMRPDQIGSFFWESECTCIVIRAVPDDESVMGFDGRYERTTYPVDFLWGPVSLQDADEWLRHNAVEPDTCDHLDRLFAVQVFDEKTYLPRRPEVLLGLPEERRKGTWHLLKADTALDAFVHIRSGPAAVEHVATGTWEEVTAHPTIVGVAPTEVSDVWVPGLRSHVAPDVGAD